VEPVIAECTHFGVAAAAARIPSSIRHIHPYLRRLDPLAAAFVRAVQSVRRGIFLVLLVPRSLELVVKEALDGAEGNVFGGAAFGGHVLGVMDGEGELAFETGVAHSMAAAEFGGFRRWEFIVEAYDALDSRTLLAKV
jgi:hypothetical protein